MRKKKVRENKNADCAHEEGDGWEGKDVIGNVPGRMSDVSVTVMISRECCVPKVPALLIPGALLLGHVFAGELATAVQSHHAQPRWIHFLHTEGLI